VVIAPGKIVLVGEYAIVEDSPAVVAAITRHAKAQFVPRMDAMPKSVAEAVRRTQIELGEVFAALPAGSVFVDDEDFRHPGLIADLGSSAATSVATVGALLETLGLPIGARRSLILAIANACRQTPGGRAGSGAAALAATHGGLVKISRAKGTPPKALAITPPSGLHLVLFSAPPSISPQRMAEGIQRYGKSDSLGLEGRMRSLRDLAQRFVDEISAGQTTAAISAAGKYGEELAKLGLAAQVPIATGAFDLAGELARELGGIAKPTGAGNGSIGVAMFATREAAALFRKASPQGITTLEGDLDRLGVRCQGPAVQTDDLEIASAPTPPPEVGRTESARAIGTATVEHATEDVDTAPTMVPSPSPDVLDSPRRRSRRSLVPVATIVAALLLGALFTVPNPLRSRLYPGAPRTVHAAPAAEMATPLPISPRPVEVPAPAPTAPTPAPAAPDKLPRTADADHSGKSASPTAPAAARRHKVGTTRRAASASHKPGLPSEALLPTGVAAVPSGAAARPAPRAGRLSSDDF